MNNIDLAKPKQFGNLHERMRYLRDLARERHDKIPSEVLTAIFDLETEVEGHKPANPPHGRRLVRIG
jgi:hypothetical protein